MGMAERESESTARARYVSGGRGGASPDSLPCVILKATALRVGWVWLARLFHHLVQKSTWPSASASASPAT